MMFVRPSAWLNASTEGYCAVTCPEHNQPASELCDHADKGSFVLQRSSKTWRAAVHECLDRCKSCKRCRFISVSLFWADCSYYARCRLKQLSQDEARSFRSARVPALQSQNSARSIS